MRGPEKGSLNIYKMMDKQYIQGLIEAKMLGTGYELITLAISAQNDILVEVDRMEGVDVEFCAELNRYLVEQLDAAGDLDYSLEVGSVSLTDPFKTKMQYQKHLNHDVEVLAKDGKKYRGVLTRVDEESFTVTVQVKEKPEGAKRPVLVGKEYTWKYNEVKYTKYLINF